MEEHGNSTLVIPRRALYRGANKGGGGGGVRSTRQAEVLLYESIPPRVSR